MFAGVSHPYAVQVVALWLSFIPALAIGALIVGALFERTYRSSRRKLDAVNIYRAVYTDRMADRREKKAA